MIRSNFAARIYRPTFQFHYTVDSIAIFCISCLESHNSVFKVMFHFTETGDLKTCKLPRSHEYNRPQSYRVDYNHNEHMNYTCQRRPDQKKQSVCVNGRWDPEVNCRGELLIITFSNVILFLPTLYMEPLCVSKLFINYFLLQIIPSWKAS